MTDQELWSAATAAVKQEYEALQDRLKVRINELVAEIGILKARYQNLAATAHADQKCAQCLGACCGHGKHHFTVVDLLGYFACGAELFTPQFDSPVCPYHHGSGCLMSPALRPFNCIIFLCEELESALSQEAKAELADIEKELRRLYYCFVWRLFWATGSRMVFLSHTSALKKAAARCSIISEEFMATINDLVLVHVEEKPGFYARIEVIVPDVKKGWWQVKLLVLSFPLQVYTWILDEGQINGEPFTMGGTPLMLEKIGPLVEREEPRGEVTTKPAGEDEGGSRAKVVSLMDRKKDKKKS